MKVLSLIAALCLLAAVLCARNSDDPYTILGISRSASTREIKRAYKQLAKEWHPDKNEAEEAKERFFLISNAYELLSDPVRKERYDKFGTVDDTKQRQPHHHYHDFFHGFNGFHGFERENSYFHQDRLTMKTYMNTILGRTHTQPYIIFVYSSFSQLAFSLENIWKSAAEDLKPLGYGVGTVNAVYEGNLLDALRCHHYPALMVVVEGRVHHYRGNMATLTPRAIRMFARDAIPKTFLFSLNTNDGLMRFVDLWKSTNKVSVLMMGPKAEPRVRYLLAAMKYSHFVRMAYVQSNDPDGAMREMKNALGVKCTHCDNMFVFNDFPEEGPVDRISKAAGTGMFSMDEINSFIEKNKYLTLPRISSFEHFDELCPVSSKCVLLPVTDAEEEEQYVTIMRKYLKKEADRFRDRRVSFAYIYINRQQKFITPFVGKLEEGPTKKRDLLVIRRVDYNAVKFTWIQSVIDADEDRLYATVQDVNKAVDNVLQGNIPVVHHTKIAELVDEYAPSFFSSLSHRTMRAFETIMFNMHKTEVLTILSIVGTLLAIFLFPYLGQLLTRPPQKRRNNATGSDSADWHPEDPTNEKATVSKGDLKLKAMSKLIHELRAETYFGLVRLLKPGCRTVVILVDSETKGLLLPTFASHVWGLRNNRTFSFAYLMVDKNLPWFRKLLENILPADTTNPDADCNDLSQQMYKRLQNINPKQTLGTVLVLCGWKLYFTIYHPMHTSHKRPVNTNYGFDDDDDSDSCSSGDDSDDVEREVQKALRNRRLQLRDVLNGFPNWLDRLLEGSIRRYSVPEWPDNIK